MGIDGNRILIHDAFVVRYDANGGQRHLPLHRDQSTISFSIALNGVGEYDGGGTYFAALGGCSSAGAEEGVMRPDSGGMVSFRGDELLHGGDPVIRGRRYIIVAFCHIAPLPPRRRDLNGGVDNEAEVGAVIGKPKKKKVKLEGMFRKEKVQQKSEKFSFGFQMPTLK